MEHSKRDGILSRISNNAGGYSFAKSGANGRILRYVFNNFDQPGRYIYLRDDDNKDFWSASWQPVGKDLNVYAREGSVKVSIDTQADKVNLKSGTLNILTDGVATIKANDYKFEAKQ